MLLKSTFTAGFRPFSHGSGNALTVSPTRSKPGTILLARDTMVSS
jgi:hypothetical protein